MALFSIVVRTGEYTHFTQIRAESAAEALRNFGRDIPRFGRHPGLADLTLTDDDPVPAKGAVSVWTATAMAGDRLENVHIVQTHEPPAFYDAPAVKPPV
jgi:hypothetical protein